MPHDSPLPALLPSDEPVSALTRDGNTTMLSILLSAGIASVVAASVMAIYGIKKVLLCK